MLTAFKLLTTAGLGAGYLWLAFAAEHPRVDAEYAAHYMHRAANCWITKAIGTGDATPPESVDFAGIGYPQACRYLRLGWWNLEPWGAWSHGDEAILRLLRRPGVQAVELTLRGVPAPGPATHVRVALGGRVVESAVQPGTTTTMIVPLPPKDEPYNPDAQLSFDRSAMVAISERSKLGKVIMERVGVGLTGLRYLPARSAAETGTP